MSGKIEISRELLQLAHDSIDEHVMNAESVKFLMLQALLAAPVVERQPIAYMRNEGTPNNLVKCTFACSGAFGVYRRKEADQ